MSNLTPKLVDAIKREFPDDEKLHAALDFRNEIYVHEALREFIEQESQKLLIPEELLKSMKTGPDTLIMPIERLDKLCNVRFLLIRLEHGDVARLADLFERVSEMHESISK